VFHGSRRVLAAATNPRATRGRDISGRLVREFPEAGRVFRGVLESPVPVKGFDEMTVRAEAREATPRPEHTSAGDA